MAGNVITSTDPAGGAKAWQVTHVDTKGQPFAVDCPSASLCVIGDLNGYVLTSTNPTGGASAWTTLFINQGIQRLSCPTTTDCFGVTGQGFVATTDPTGGASAWHAFSVAGADISTVISCPAARLCVASDVAGDIITSTSPAGGKSAWHLVQVNGTTAIAAVSCPSRRLCVAGDFMGNIVTSTDPAAAKWKFTALPKYRPDQISALSCPSASRCVALTSRGVLTSADPAGGAAAWHFYALDAGAAPGAGLSRPVAVPRLRQPRSPARLAPPGRRPGGLAPLPAGQQAGHHQLLLPQRALLRGL